MTSSTVAVAPITPAVAPISAIKCLHKTVFGATFLVKQRVAKKIPDAKTPRAQDFNNEEAPETLVVLKVSNLYKAQLMRETRGSAEDPVREAEILSALPPHPSIVQVAVR
eukprot:gb/GEZN01022953.1/.p1 GENE.gb/GEZN01022953.1/~~gb/GEZN01022953.1/.p1  ORF type:complete len:110 (-),score=7.48 gb/GEZN01022953.1/:151-480(-)